MVKWLCATDFIIYVHNKHSYGDWCIVIGTSLYTMYSSHEQECTVNISWTDWSLYKILFCEELSFSLITKSLF